MEFEYAINVLKDDLTLLKHGLESDKPHKNSCRYKMYKSAIKELERAIEYLMTAPSN